MCRSPACSPAWCWARWGWGLRGGAAGVPASDLCRGAARTPEAKGAALADWPQCLNWLVVTGVARTADLRGTKQWRAWAVPSDRAPGWAFECEAAALAASRATEADLQRIGAAFALEAVFAEGTSPEVLAQQVDADLAFHQAIAEAAHNVMFGHLTASLFRVDRKSVV